MKKVQHDYARWLEEIQRVAFFDVRKLFDANGEPIPVAELPDDVAVAGAEVGEDGAIKLKYPNKLSALETFGRATGYYQEKVATPELS